MKPDPRLERLHQIATLKRDLELAKVVKVQQAIDRLRAGIAALARTAPPDPQVSLAASARASLRYEAWADTRRRAMNEELARHLARLEDQQIAAQRAFGRAGAVNKLQGNP